MKDMIEMNEKKRNVRKEIFFPAEHRKILIEVIDIVKDKIGIKLYQKKLLNVLLWNPNALSDLAIKNIQENSTISLQEGMREDEYNENIERTNEMKKRTKYKVI